MARTKTRILAAGCLFSSFLSTSAASWAVDDASHLFGLLPRDDATCHDSSYAKCSGNFPGNFCCATDSTCMSVNDGKSALCCPQGKDCSIIGTISCDIQQQNATAHPLSQLFSTDLTTTLPKCGNLCCPAGMTCSGSSQCVLAQSSSPTAATSPNPTSSQPAATSSPASSAAPTAKSSDSAVAISASKSSDTPKSQEHCNKWPTTALLVGFFSGLIVGIILAICGICCLGRSRHHQQQDKRESGDLSSVQASVSDPIYNEDASHYRTDFLRRGSSPNNRRSQTSSTIRSMFSRAGTIRSRPSVPSIPKTPKTPSMKRQPSTESIFIYSPPNLGMERPTTQHTTFGEMMREVGLKENGPYLGSPGRVDPRSRRLDQV